jgi:glutamine---fructose-6-phosphate transaminase (isomerizing)
VVKGLRRLEYRGYDSAGVVFKNPQTQLLTCSKTKGKVSDLESQATQLAQGFHLGMGHTRWATHGAPSDRNSHPHLSNNQKLALVHNGIIENYASIKTMLSSKGFVFHSDTDTEVLVNLIQWMMDEYQLDWQEATRAALNQVNGAYAIAVLHEDAQNEMLVARLSSPLAIGLGKDEYYVASDASPFVEYTREVIFLEDAMMAKISLENGVEINAIKDNQRLQPLVQELKLNLEQIEKSGYDHFMLKEIFEQPKSIQDTLRGRLLPDESIIKMQGLWDHMDKFTQAKRIIITACGTSWHAGLIGEYLLEEFTRIPVEVEYASEFRYRNPIINEDDIVIAISQSGETADTLAAIKLAKEKGAFVFGICNVVDSSIARMAHAGAYTHAGPEIGVASTKAFTAQVSVLSMMAMAIGKAKGKLSTLDFNSLSQELYNMPKKVEEVLKSNDLIKNIAKIFYTSTNFLYLGRGFNFPAALEAALKLKEISYIHAEGYPAAEMKHGPIALIDEHMPTVIIAPKKGHYDKILSNVQEIKARSARIIAVVNYGDTEVKALAEHCIEIPETAECFSPILASIPLQLLSYHIAVLRGANVDQPRNLAKSVTVE